MSHEVEKLKSQGRYAAAQADIDRHSALAGPDPVWLCEACGVVQPGWSAACLNCHVAGRMVWGSAQRPRLLAAS